MRIIIINNYYYTTQNAKRRYRGTLQVACAVLLQTEVRSDRVAHKWFVAEAHRGVAGGGFSYYCCSDADNQSLSLSLSVQYSCVLVVGRRARCYYRTFK